MRPLSASTDSWRKAGKNLVPLVCALAKSERMDRIFDHLGLTEPTEEHAHEGGDALGDSLLGLISGIDHPLEDFLEQGRAEGREGRPVCGV